MSVNESVTEFLRFFLPKFPLPTFWSVRVLEVVVEVDNCGGTESGTSASPFSVVLKGVLHTRGTWRCGPEFVPKSGN